MMPDDLHEVKITYNLERIKEMTTNITEQDSPARVGFDTSDPQQGELHVSTGLDLTENWFDGNKPKARASQVYREIVVLYEVLRDECQGRTDVDANRLFVDFSPKQSVALWLTNSFGVTVMAMLQCAFPAMQMEKLTDGWNRLSFDSEADLKARVLSYAH